MQVLETELLEFAEQVVEAEPMRDRRVDLERFARDATALFRLDRVERAHVVQPVGELDQHDAHVARHRQQHLAEVLGLRLLGRRELQLVELRDAVDQLGDGAAEALGQLVLRDAGILQHVVQQRCLDRGTIEVPVGQDLGDRQRVRDVRRAAAPELAEMRLVGEAERLLDLLDVGRREVLLDALGQRGDGGHAIGRRFSRVAAPYGLFQRFGRAPGKAGLRRLIGGKCGILWPHRACRASGLASHGAGHDKP